MRHNFRTTALLALPVLASGAAYAQATSGSIIGTVTDSTGAVVSTAKVTITSEDRGVSYSTVTNESGNYSQTQLPTGSYRVEFEAQGFQRYIQAQVRVALDRATRLDAQLTVGQVSEQVNVTSEVPLLVTDRAEVSSTLDAKQLRDLPALNRNITQLQMLMPGANRVQFQHASSENPQGGFQINNNGQDFGSTNFMIDGTDNNDPVLGIIIINPNLDAVGEFKYTTANYDAEFAQAGGAVIQVETKAGSNALHGSWFHFLKNSEFNARNPFSEPNGPPPLKWNQFGGSLGGPIRRNKLFFFGDYQGTRQRTGASLLTTVPTAAVRGGNLSAFNVPVFDPATGSADGSGRLQFAGNLIPANRIVMPARNLINLLPLPNSGTAVNNNYIAAGSEQFDSNTFDVKIDHHVTSNFRYFSRYSYAGYLKNTPPAFGAPVGGPGLAGLFFAGRSEARNQNFVSGFNYTLRPTLLTDFRFGYSRYRVNVLPLDFGSTPAQQAGLPNANLPNRPDTSGLPSFVIDGNGGFRFGYSLAVNQCNCPLNEREFVFQMVNNWTRIAGNHTFKWGADVRRAQNLRLPSDRRRNGNFAFGPTATGALGTGGSGLGPATFLLGMVTGFERFSMLADPNPEDLQWRMFYFVQDSWRINSKLTFSLGVRWDTWFPNQSLNPGQGGRYDVTTNNIVIAGLGGNSKSANVETQWKNFSPRLAIAYQMTPRMVIRAGFGRSYFQEIFGNTFNNTANTYPTLINQTPAQPNPYTQIFNLTTGAPAVAFPSIPQSGLLQLPNGIGAGYRPPDIRYSFVESWNFSMERLLSSTMTGTVSYVGNGGRFLRQGFPLNQAIPGSGPFNPRRPLFNRFGLTQGINDNSNAASNSYQSLQTKLTGRAGRNYSFLSTYTWSKTINTAGGLMLNARINRGVADFDRAHTFTLAHNVTLPFGKGQRWLGKPGRAADVVISGWEFNGATILQSGFPFSPTLNNNASINADIGLRPDVLPNVDRYDVPGGQNRDRWFNIAAYRVPGPFLFGTAGRNSLRAPGSANVDLSLSKRFHITEQKSLQFRWEVYNAINRANLGVPPGAIDAGANAVARITSLGTAQTMRQMQLGLRFDF